ncbi:MAG TPA: ABC transporter permease subunit [Anaerolineales bacterium]|nr:ABC transporter permease subunit [Anaerolineales bacterium]
MSDTTVELSDKRPLSEPRIKSANWSLPSWWLVFGRELNELWIWGRALTLIILYSIYLGISSFIFASNNELSLIPPREMVYLTISGAITVGLFIALVIGADSFSGERERSTLEALLLTPARRRQIVIGKFLASISPWPVAMVIAIPYVVVLSQGDEILRTALVWSAIVGSLLAPAFTGFAMLVSLWSGSNRTSLFTSLTVYLLLLLPVQFPSGAQTGMFGKLLKQLDPLDGAAQFLEKLIVGNRTVQELMPLLWSGIGFALLIFMVLFLYAAPRLRLDAGIPIKLRRKKSSIVLSILLVLLLSLSAVRGQALQQSAGLQITIDKTSATAKTGDKVEFHTTVTNHDSADSPPLIIAMNIINLDASGDVVDPEDWSPERTQYVSPLTPGNSVTQSWVLNTILDGDYMVYMVLIPAPVNQTASSHPLTSMGIHVIVNRFVRINPGGILPFAVGIPILLILLMAGLVWIRRRNIDPGSSPINQPMNIPQDNFMNGGSHETY